MPNGTNKHFLYKEVQKTTTVCAIWNKDNLSCWEPFVHVNKNLQTIRWLHDLCEDIRAIPGCDDEVKGNNYPAST